jgi:hypothetical protein
VYLTYMSYKQPPARRPQPSAVGDCLFAPSGGQVLPIISCTVYFQRNCTHNIVGYYSPPLSPLARRTSAFISPQGTCCWAVAVWFGWQVGQPTRGAATCRVCSHIVHHSISVVPVVDARLCPWQVEPSCNSTRLCLGSGGAWLTRFKATEGLSQYGCGDAAQSVINEPRGCA